MNYATTILLPIHAKEKFCSGNEKLDDYIKKQAKQDIKSRAAICFVLAENNNIIKGYYTLSNGSIPREHLPEGILQKLPKYKDLPVTILGRLAVDLTFQGKKQGQLLLLDALKRSLDTAASIASLAVFVDPIDKKATDFYAKFGFMQLPDSDRMFLPMATIASLFSTY